MSKFQKLWLVLVVTLTVGTLFASFAPKVNAISCNNIDACVQGFSYDEYCAPGGTYPCPSNYTKCTDPGGYASCGGTTCWTGSYCDGALAEPPPVCGDSSACNYGQAGTCDYTCGTTPKTTCQDPKALNYNVSLPCSYPAGTTCNCIIDGQCRSDSSCATPTERCGDSRVGVGEQCDLGNDNGATGSYCSGSCQFVGSGTCPIPSNPYWSDLQSDLSTYGNYVENGTCYWLGNKVYSGCIAQSPTKTAVGQWRYLGGNDDAWPDKWVCRRDNINPGEALYQGTTQGPNDTNGNQVTYTQQNCIRRYGCQFVAVPPPPPPPPTGPNLYVNNLVLRRNASPANCSNGTVVTSGMTLTDGELLEVCVNYGNNGGSDTGSSFSISNYTNQASQPLAGDPPPGASQTYSMNPVSANTSGATQLGGIYVSSSVCASNCKAGVFIDSKGQINETSEADNFVNSVNYNVASAVTLVAAPSSVNVGQPVTVTWGNVTSPATLDWIGLYLPGAADTTMVKDASGNEIWLYTSSCSQTGGSTAKVSGSCSFPMNTVGTYEFRLFANDQYVPKYATSNQVNVTASILYPLAVAKSGTGTGTVTSVPSGINCGGTCSANYNSGTSVTLTPAAANGSAFIGWSGACTGSGTCTVTMSAARNVTATFNLSAVNYTLTVTKNGTGVGTVTSAPAGINCGSTCSSSYAGGVSVTLTPSVGSGNTFAGWSGACTGTGACTVLMNAAKSVNATFNTSVAVSYNLTVSKAGTGSGTVSSSPLGISCGSTCSALFNDGTSVTLSASANSGSDFIGWSGACTGSGGCTLSMTANRSVTATFNTSAPPPPPPPPPPPTSLNVSCTALPSPAFVGKPVTWTATVSNGTGPYTYSWTGDVPSPSPVTSTFSITYTSTGVKSAIAIVTDSSLTPISGGCRATTDPAQIGAPGSGTVKVILIPNQEEF